jgi:hypothetical protein
VEPDKGRGKHNPENGKADQTIPPQPAIPVVQLYIPPGSTGKNWKVHAAGPERRRPGLVRRRIACVEFRVKRPDRDKHAARIRRETPGTNPRGGFARLTKVPFWL